MTDRRLALLALTAALALMAVAPGPAAAASPGPGWLVSSVALPTNFSSADNAKCQAVSQRFCDYYQVTVTNVGGEATSGPIVISDSLPAGLEAVQVKGHLLNAAEQSLGCGAAPPRCEYGGSVLPGGTLSMVVKVEVTSASGSVFNEATVTGGGAPSASTSEPLTTPNTVDGSPAAFGFAGFNMEAFDPSGALDEQAAAHPNYVTTMLNLNTDLNTSNGSSGPVPAQQPKDVLATLPMGLVGNPLAAARCTAIELYADGGEETNCAPASRVGTALLLTEGIEYSSRQISVGAVTDIYNMEPEKGFPAEFGFKVLGKAVTLYASLVHTASGYALRVGAPGIPTTIGVEGLALSFFGDPHSADGEPEASEAFFTNPSDCGAGTLNARIEANAWAEPGNWPFAEQGTYPGISGCDQLHFEPTFTITPDKAEADSPTGPSVDLKVPQAEPKPEALATPPLRDASVTLPAGLAVNPSAADGLVGCGAEGPNGINIGSNDIGPTGQDLGDPEATELGAGHLGGNGSPYDDGLYHTAPGHCPQASQIGTVKVTTPLLEAPLSGRVYLGTPDCSPCTNAAAAAGKLLHLYIEAEGSGVIVKLPGSVSADPTTGQLTARFDNNPQLPFEDLKLKFSEGARAPLRTPSTCGHFTTTTDLEPWSAPETADANPSSSFDVSSGPNGGPCVTDPGQRGLHPSFEAGTTNPVAGAFTPFVMNLKREDGEQELSTLNVTTPPGIAADLRGVPYCPDAALAQAAGKSGAGERANPSCPAASQVGTVNVGAGAGPDPYYVSGKVYLAGPYKGAPLSLAIITPAVAGPFDLGTVVVRAATYLDPTDAHLRVVSDPLPKILAGIPLDIRDLRVNIDRPHFTDNPTDCEPMSLFADVFGSSGAATRLANRFQVGDCGALGFKPKLAIGLKGATQRRGHPALTATLTMPPGQANISSAQVTLPHSEFLDQAHIGTVCTRVQFSEGAGNGTGCPPASIYGHARAITPLLNKPLEGPVYLRSSTHKLPDLIAALGGQIDIALAGKVDSGRGGGLRNTFEVVPDAPVSKFTLSMRGGAKGLLENSEDLCAHPQRAIATFMGQNGRVEDLKPPIANSCGKTAKRKPGRGR